MTEPSLPEDILASQGFEDWVRQAGVSLVLASADGARVLGVGAESDGRFFACEVLGANAQRVTGGGDRFWTVGDRRAALWIDGPGLYSQTGDAPRGFCPRRVTYHGATVPDAACVDDRSRLWFRSNSGWHRVDEVGAAAVVSDARGLPGDAVPFRFEDGVPVGWTRVDDHGTELEDDGRLIRYAGASLAGVVGFGAERFAVDRGSCDLVRLAADGGVTPVATVPGVPTAVTVMGGTLVVALSKRPEGGDERGVRALAEKGVEPRAGLVMIDPASGRTVHWLRWLRVVEGVGGVVTTQGTRPVLVGMEGL